MNHRHRATCLAFLIFGISTCSKAPTDTESVPPPIPAPAPVVPNTPDPVAANEGKAVAANEAKVADTPQVDAVSGASEAAYDGKYVEILADFDASLLLAHQSAAIRAQRDKPVYVVHEPNPSKSAYELMKKLSPALRSDLRVLIKPNLGGFGWFKMGADKGVSGRTTDLGFIEGIVDYLEENGVTKISIAESWGVKTPEEVRRLFRVSGLERLASRHASVTLVDMNHYAGGDSEQSVLAPVAIPVPSASRLEDELVLPRIYVDHLMNGLVINVPKLKTHQFAVMTGGMKNLMGVLGLKGSRPPHQNKRQMHRELNRYVGTKNAPYDDERKRAYVHALTAFSERLADVYSASSPHMTLIDAVVATQGDGFDKTSAVPMSIAVGSYNTVYADVVAAKLVGMWDNDELREFIGSDAPPYLRIALNRFFGGAQAATEITVVDDGNDTPRNLRFHLIGMAPFEIAGNATRKLSGEGVVRAKYLKRDTRDKRDKRDATDLEELLASWPLDRTVWITRDWSGRDVPPGISTAVAAAYTDKEVVFLFQSRVRQFAAIHSDPKKGDVARLYSGDVVEVFLDPDPSTPQAYLEFEASPAGERLDLAVDLAAKKYDTDFESGMRVVSSVDRDHGIWSAAIAVPFNDAWLPAPKPGDEWRVNFFRSEGRDKGRLYMAWSPTETGKPNFHVPSRFGTLVFSAETAPRPD